MRLEALAQFPVEAVVVLVKAQALAVLEVLEAQVR